MGGGRRNRKREKVTVNEDRISGLPDCILHQILVLINIKDAVQTCILSKRWRYIWTSLPNLDFDYDEFPFCCVRCGAHCYDYTHKMRRFTKFVTGVLSLSDSPIIGKFRLSSGYITDPSFVRKCISYAIRHHVQELDISAYCYPKPFSFPNCFSACKSLTILKLLCYYRSMQPPKSFCLPALRTLHLERFSFGFSSSSDFSGEFFSSFPNLQDLTLRNCHIEYVKICVPQLRNLEILFRRYGQSNPIESEIAVFTPRLTSFKFEGHVSLVCSMEDLPCLEKVYINLCPRFLPFFDDVKERMPLNLIKMLGHFRNAEVVTLSLETIEVLAMDPNSVQSHPSPFCNLKHLRLIAQEKCSTLPFNVMTFLTKGSPHVDTMVVEFLVEAAGAIRVKTLEQRVSL